MPVKFLGFDIENFIKSIFAPYATALSIFVLATTIILSVVLFIPDVRNMVGFYQWGDGVVIVAGLGWFIGTIVSFLLVLQFFGISLSQFGNLFVALDIILLALLITTTSIMPGQQVCGLAEQCGLVGNGLFLFIFFQPLIIGTYARIKYRYSTGRDLFLWLRKVFGPKS